MSVPRVPSMPGCKVFLPQDFFPAKIFLVLSIFHCKLFTLQSVLFLIWMKTLTLDFNLSQFFQKRFHLKYIILRRIPLSRVVFSCSEYFLVPSISPAIFFLKTFPSHVYSFPSYFISVIISPPSISFNNFL